MLSTTESHLRTNNGKTDRQTETKKEAEVVTLNESTPSRKPS